MYQKYEYATGHWLQKSTEHILGSFFYLETLCKKAWNQYTYLYPDCGLIFSCIIFHDNSNMLLGLGVDKTKKGFLADKSVI